jgi:hypothetical protein
MGKILLLIALFAPFLLIAAGAVIRQDDSQRAGNSEKQR